MCVCLSSSINSEPAATSDGASRVASFLRRTPVDTWGRGRRCHVRTARRRARAAEKQRSPPGRRLAIPAVRGLRQQRPRGCPSWPPSTRPCRRCARGGGDPGSAALSSDVVTPPRDAAPARPPSTWRRTAGRCRRPTAEVILCRPACSFLVGGRCSSPVAAAGQELYGMATELPRAAGRFSASHCRRPRIFHIFFFFFFSPAFPRSVLCFLAGGSCHRLSFAAAPPRHVFAPGERRFGRIPPCFRFIGAGRKEGGCTAYVTPGALLFFLAAERGAARSYVRMRLTALARDGEPILALTGHLGASVSAVDRCVASSEARLSAAACLTLLRFGSSSC